MFYKVHGTSSTDICNHLVLLCKAIKNLAWPKWHCLWVCTCFKAKVPKQATFFPRGEYGCHSKGFDDYTSTRNLNTSRKNLNKYMITKAFQFIFFFVYSYCPQNFVLMTKWDEQILLLEMSRFFSKVMVQLFSGTSIHL